jgi:hypothetical protein
VNFDAHMRIGSLEILAGLALFGVLAARVRPSSSAARARATAMRVRLNVRDAVGGPAREVAFALGEGEKPAIVGRSSEADVGVLDPEVSRRHARFDLAKGVLYLTDLESSNGTFLNGKLLGNEGIEVRAGDDIDVGNTRISVMGTEPSAWT